MDRSNTMEGTMTLDREIEAFGAMKAMLEVHHMGKYVVIRGGDLVGSFDSLDTAAAFAVSQYGRGPYLIRQVGAPPAHLPASVLYRPTTEYSAWTKNANP